MRQNLSIDKELRDAFLLYCKSRGQKMSSVIQIIIKKVISGEINLIEEKKDDRN